MLQKAERVSSIKLRTFIINSDECYISLLQENLNFSAKVKKVRLYRMYLNTEGLLMKY